MEFALSSHFCLEHFLNPLNSNLLCVRAKDPANRSRKDAGYWVGHFQILEVLSMEEDATKVIDEKDEVKVKVNFKKEEKYFSAQAGLIHSSTRIPEALITRRFSYVTVELIFLGIPDRLV